MWLHELINYWYEKRTDIEKINTRDLKQALIITKIKLLNYKKTRTILKLSQIVNLHPINRKSSLEKLKKRIKILKSNKKHLLSLEYISTTKLENILPSINNLLVIKLPNNKYLVWEGNGRIKALKEIFPTNLKIEVIEYLLNADDLKEIFKLFKNLDNIK